MKTTTTDTATTAQITFADMLIQRLNFAQHMNITRGMEYRRHSAEINLYSIAYFDRKGQRYDAVAYKTKEAIVNQEWSTLADMIGRTIELGSENCAFRIICQSIHKSN